MRQVPTLLLVNVLGLLSLRRMTMIRIVRIGFPSKSRNTPSKWRKIVVCIRVEISGDGGVEAKG